MLLVKDFKIITRDIFNEYIGVLIACKMFANCGKIFFICVKVRKIILQLAVVYSQLMLSREQN